jgi:glucosamine-6-phosphate deaminase
VILAKGPRLRKPLLDFEVCMDVVVVDGAEALGEPVARLVSGLVERDPASVLGVATGGTPLPVYRVLARGSTDFSAVHLVALDEYVGLPAGHPASYAAYVEREIAVPLGIPTDHVVVPQRSGAELERRIAELGGVDLQLLGIGRNGHLAFNEPGSPLDSRSRVVALTESTRRDNAAYVEPVPSHAITQGLGTILEARHLVLLATGAAKAEAVAAALTGPVTPDCPASVVRRHPQVTVVLDAAAASALQRRGSVDRTERERIHHPQL